jgi:uncharacterized membrane protein
MKIISIILLVIGMLLCAVGSFGSHFFTHQVMYDIMHADTGGIGSIASGLTNAWYLSFVSIAGCVVIFLGVILNIVAMVRAKKPIS